MTKDELIAALEKADRPSFKLDNVIDLMAFDHGWRVERFGTPDITPRYTASIDAALTLVPEGCGFVLMGCAAKVGREIAKGATPAIALCIAALRARA